MIRTLDVGLVGVISYPTFEELVQAIEAVEPPGMGITTYYPIACHDPVCLIGEVVDDVGARVLVDDRDGRVLFYGTTVWMGSGEVIDPAVSSHEWTVSAGDPAPEPATIDIFPNPSWNDEVAPPAELVDEVLVYLRHTDVVKSFGSCGPYDVEAYIYTPIENYGVDPETASLIVVVNGYCGSPWGDPVTASLPDQRCDMSLSINPNPFNPRTNIRFSLAQDSFVSLRVYDVEGRLVNDLVQGDLVEGAHDVRWNGTDMNGATVASGVYMARIVTDGQAQMRKLVVLK